MRVFSVKYQEIKYTLHNEAWGIGKKGNVRSSLTSTLTFLFICKVKCNLKRTFSCKCLSLSHFEKNVDTSGVPALVFRLFFFSKMKSYATCKDVLLRRNAAFHLASGHILHNSIPCCGKVFWCVFNECLNTKALFFFFT